MTKRLSQIVLLLAAIVLAGSQAIAQRPYGDRSDRYGYDEQGSRRGRGEAGVFDYYVLSLSWSPTYCAGLRDGRYDRQCDRRQGRPYAFVLHGLWPQYTRGWPQYCRSDDRGFVPRPVANRMLDIMPSDKLVFNEYRKHGTCSGLGVDGYFDLARQLYESVRIPKRYVGLTDDRLLVSPRDVIDDFLSANPDLKPDMIAITCGGTGPRLREVRICFNKEGHYRACGRNEDQRRLCSAERIYVPPVRAGGRRDEPDDSSPSRTDERRL